MGKNKNQSKRQREEKLLKEETLFQEGLPEEILRELTPEIRRQYFLWDEILKREVELYPWLTLPLIEESFHKKYQRNIKIQLLSTEYTISRIHETGEKLLHSIRADLLLRIGGELYHFECQMKSDKNMVFRMLEYDTGIALRHSSGESQLSFPKSVVLYLNHSKNTPDYESCTLHFQDGSSHLYQVPVMKVQKYSLDEIEEKHLNLLIPFLPIRFARRIKNSKEAGRKRLKEDLTEFLSECIMILNREKENGALTECAWNDIMEFLYKACGHLLEEEPELLEEVYENMEPAIKLNREIIKELQDDKKELSRQLESGIIKLIQRLKNEGKSIEAAREALEDVFSLDKKEAKAKAEFYWEEK